MVIIQQSKNMMSNLKNRRTNVREITEVNLIKQFHERQDNIIKKMDLLRRRSFQSPEM